MALAAERKDDTFEAELAAAWNLATQTERDQANAIWRNLKKTYGDAVALPNAERRFHHEMDNITGSRVGMPGHVSIWISSEGPIDVSEFKKSMDRKADLNFGKLPEGSVIVEPLAPYTPPDAH